VRIVDIRPTTKEQYREIFAPAPGAALVHFIYEKDPSSNQKISLSLDRPVVTVYPEAIMSLKDFGLRFNEKVQKLMTQNSTPVAENKQVAAQQVKSATQTVLLLDLNEIALSLLDGDTNVHTVVVVVAVSNAFLTYLIALWKRTGLDSYTERQSFESYSKIDKPST
jgi:hypothetical protein